MSVPEDTFVPASEQGQTPDASRAPAPADDGKTQQQDPQQADGDPEVLLRALVRDAEQAFDHDEIVELESFPVVRNVTRRFGW